MTLANPDYLPPKASPLKIITLGDKALKCEGTNFQPVTRKCYVNALIAFTVLSALHVHVSSFTPQASLNGGHVSRACRWQSLASNPDNLVPNSVLLIST